MVNEINEANLTWKAEVHREFRGMSLIELRKNLGLRSRQKFSKNDKAIKSNNRPNNINFIQKKKSYADMGLNKEQTDFLNSLHEEKENINEKKISNLLKNSETKSKEASLNSSKSNSNTKSNLINASNLDRHDTDEGRDKDSADETDYAEISKYINKNLEEIDENKLPKNWDWRNVGGKNYIPSVKRQGDCGSCYVFSSITLLEARLRIKTDNNDQTTFSKQFALSCNFYSEGCDGGYPFLVGKFFNEFEIVPEECFPYTQSDSECSKVCDYKNKYSKKYRVSNYGYIGGYYGATNEILMIKEIRARGPIPGNIRVPLTFNYYKHGIYSESSIEKNAEKLSKTTMVDRNLSWEKVEHSITLVGYGEENGVKYWIGMNTWGNIWGENGFFKILRGENDCAIESMGEFMNIEVTTR
jgi:C1A family cysteine protease